MFEVWGKRTGFKDEMVGRVADIVVSLEKGMARSHPEDIPI